ncbi:MAG TPA: Uma2 family endonuclease [Gemmataceae bacterium]|nr:Uma2 family endonuclease [Gemmataceae bacterium]
MAIAIEKALMTAEEFLRLPNDGRLRELVRGRVVYMNVPAPRHGQICVKVVRLIGNFADEYHLGHVVSNDSGVPTERGPDTVRGADVAFYSYSRVPPGPFPQGYLPVVPELVFEVRSPTDRWSPILAKVAEYLEAGVSVVCVLDQMTERCHVYRNEEEIQVFLTEQDLTIPDVLPEFRVVVRRFFE